jgi:hypothetical protein
MTLSFVSPLLVICSAGVIIALERLYPYDPGQSLYRSGFLNDLALYAIIQSCILGFVIFFLVSWFDQQTGLSPRRQLAALLAGCLLFRHSRLLHLLLSPLATSLKTALANS